MTFTDLAKSHVRTVVPFVVGLVASLALRAGIDVHGYAPEITVAVGWLYYAAARAAEHYLSPRFGWLLGAVGAPKYKAAKTPRKRAAKDRGLTAIGAVLIVLIALVAIGLGWAVHPLWLLLLLLVVLVLVA